MLVRNISIPSTVKSIVGALVVLAFLAVGCNAEREEIRTYSVNKPLPLEAVGAGKEKHSVQPTETRQDDRLIAAMIPQRIEPTSSKEAREHFVWFFRLSGPAAAVEAERERFRTFVQSVTFGEDHKPVWKLHDGWTVRPKRQGEDMRFATINVGAADNKVELTVSVLPRDIQLYPLLATYYLNNVNRWRGQLGLSTMTMRDFEAIEEKLSLAEGTATLVELVGHFDAAKMPKAPFAPPQATKGDGDG